MRFSPVRHLSVVAIAVGAAACDPRPAPRRSLLAARAAAAPTPAAALGPIDGTPELAVDAACGDSLETAALRCAEGAVTRRGDTLTIVLSDGRTVTRRDNAAHDDAFVSFGYAGRMGGASGTPIFHILDVVSSDAYAVELINARTGDSVTVGGRPLLSPDGTRVAVATLDPDVCDESNKFEIWRVTSDVPTRELSITPWNCGEEGGWGASQLEWTARDTVTLLRKMPSRDPGHRVAGGVDTSEVRFVRGPSGWTRDRRSR